jgi:uncharacterized RDD family membrane protein YckC
VSVAPGWYKDPAEPTTQRWWDGEGWVGERLPADAIPPPGPPPASRLREPQVPAVPGLPGAAEASAPPPPPAGPVPPPEPGHPTGEVPPGWPYQVPMPASSAPPRPHGYPLATLGARLVARLVDLGAILALNIAVNGWFVYRFWTEISPVMEEAWRRGLAGESMSDLPEVGDQAGVLQIIILMLAAALWFAYEVPAIANTGQTPGKRLLRIKVVRLENPHGSAAGMASSRQTEPPALGFGRSFRRWNTMGLPTLLWWCFGLGLLLQLVDVLFAVFDRPLQQALHDKSAHTAVISTAAGQPPVSPARSKEATDESPPTPPADPS